MAASVLVRPLVKPLAAGGWRLGREARLAGAGTNDGAGHRTLGIVAVVLLVDLITTAMLFPLYAEAMRHYAALDQATGDQGGQTLFGLLLGQLQALFPGADGEQRAALFGGLLSGLTAGLQFLTAPFWGRLSDRFGRRPVILCSLLGSVAAHLLWLHSITFAGFVLARIVAGLLSGNVAAANAVVADVTPPDQRGRGMALVGMTFALGFVLGPAIGGFSQRFAPWFLPEVVLANPFAGPAAIAVALAAGNLLWALLALPETLALPEARGGSGADTGTLVRSANPLRLFSADLGHQFPRIAAAGLLQTLLFSAMETTLVFLVASRLGFRADHGMIGLFLAMGVGSALVQGGLYRPLSRRFGERRTVMTGFAALVPALGCLGLIGWWPTPLLLIPGVLLLNLGTGLAFPGLTTLASLAGDPRRQGAVMGTYRSAAALGRVCGPLLAALVYFAVAPGAPCVLAAVGMLLPLALVGSLSRGGQGLQSHGIVDPTNLRPGALQNHR